MYVNTHLEANNSHYNSDVDKDQTWTDYFANMYILH